MTAERIEPLCRKCKMRPVEVIDDWTSVQCRTCNGRDIEHANARREWHYYHSD